MTKRPVLTLKKNVSVNTNTSVVAPKPTGVAYVGSRFTVERDRDQSLTVAANGKRLLTNDGQSVSNKIWCTLQELGPLNPAKPKFANTKAKIQELMEGEPRIDDDFLLVFVASLRSRIKKNFTGLEARASILSVLSEIAPENENLKAIEDDLERDRETKRRATDQSDKFGSQLSLKSGRDSALSSEFLKDIELENHEAFALLGKRVARFLLHTGEAEKIVNLAGIFPILSPNMLGVLRDAISSDQVEIKKISKLLTGLDGLDNLTKGGKKAQKEIFWLAALKCWELDDKEEALVFAHKLWLINDGAGDFKYAENVFFSLLDFNHPIAIELRKSHGDEIIAAHMDTARLNLKKKQRELNRQAVKERAALVGQGPESDVTRFANPFWDGYNLAPMDATAARVTSSKRND